MYVFKVEDMSLKKQFKLTSLSESKPEIRFYPNAIEGELKDKSSFGILFNKDTKDLSSILEEISQNLNNHIIDI